MSRETEFAQALQSVRRKAKEQNNIISGEQVREAFAQLSLTKEQLEMVFDYLKKHQVGIDKAPETEEAQEALSGEDARYPELYLEELRALPTVDEAQRDAVTLAAMAGDKIAKEKLIEIYLPRVAEVAGLYAGQGALPEDLIGEGNLALAAGVELLVCEERVDEAQGTLIRMVMDAMETYIADNLQAAEIDSEVVRRVNEVNDKARELAEGLLRKVTVEELVQETDMNREDIEEALLMSGKLIEYIEQE